MISTVAGVGSQQAVNAIGMSTARIEKIILMLREAEVDQFSASLSAFDELEQYVFYPIARWVRPPSLLNGKLLSLAA